MSARPVEQRKSGMSQKKWTLSLAILALMLLHLPGKAIAAEEYPTKPITILCGFTAGGSIDRMARVLQPFLQKALGSPIQVENLTGAGGILAHNKVFSSPPDGYTLMIAASPTMILLEKYFSETARYQWRDLTTVFSFVKDDHLLMGHPDDWKDFAAFATAAKSRRLRVGTAGKGADGHLRAIMIEDMAGVKFNLIPFEGGAQAVTNLMGKHVDAAMSSVSSSFNLLRSGSLNPLLVFSRQRNHVIPQTPTIQEVFPKFELMLYFIGIFGPPKLPSSRIKVLEEAFFKAIKEQELQDKIKEMGLESFPLNSRDFAAQNEQLYPLVDKYVKILKERD